MKQMDHKVNYNPMTLYPSSGCKAMPYIDVIKLDRFQVLY